jgi:hypothetical protein
MKQQRSLAPIGASRLPAAHRGLRALEPHELKLVSGGEPTFPVCKEGQSPPTCIRRPTVD